MQIGRSARSVFGGVRATLLLIAKLGIVAAETNRGPQGGGEGEHPLQNMGFYSISHEGIFSDSSIISSTSHVGTGVRLAYHMTNQSRKGLIICVYIQMDAIF